MISQTRNFSLTEKIKIKCQRLQSYPNSLLQIRNKFNESFDNENKNWILLNQPKIKESFKIISKTLIIYPYSLSNNLLKEVLLKMGVQFILTNDIRKANVIIGLKKTLSKNEKLKTLLKQKKIPIYVLHHISLYEIAKFITFCNFL